MKKLTKTHKTGEKANQEHFDNFSKIIKGSDVCHVHGRKLGG